MNSSFDLFGAFVPDVNIRRKPICNTCIYQKKGLTTLCENYKRIPADVQRGKYCEKYLRVEEEK